MYHRISEVAKTYKFDQYKFNEFCFANVDKYGLIFTKSLERGPELEVGTWYADALIRDFQNLTSPATR